ncbi:MAG: hypothetical protein ACREVW_17610 [Burkholderiales bacterium]
MIRTTPITHHAPSEPSPWRKWLAAVFVSEAQPMAWKGVALARAPANVRRRLGIRARRLMRADD